MRLRGSRVVVKRVATPDKVGHIWIPERARQKTLEGVVTQAGDEVQDLRVGDRVLFGRYAWSEFSYAGKDHVLLWERDVWAVLE